MKRIILTLAVAFVIMGSAGLYADQSGEPKLITESDTYLAKDEGFVGIGTRDPEGNLHIKEIGTDHENFPRIYMDDVYSGYRFQIRIDEESVGSRLQFYYPCAGTEPGWGMYMRVNDNQDMRFFGDINIKGADPGIQTPARDNVRLGVGIGATSPMQSTAPGGGQNGIVDARDVYVRSANDWMSMYMAVTTLHTLHMAKMYSGTAQSIPSGSNSGLQHKIEFTAEEFDIGNIADYGTTDGFTIGQDGLYLVTASWWCPDFERSDRDDDDSELSVYIFVDYAGDTEGFIEALHAGAFVKGPEDSDGCVSLSDALNLSDGDKIEMRVSHTAARGHHHHHHHDGSRSTFTDEARRPQMSVIQLH